MKKIIFVFILLFLLSGCTLFQKKEEMPTVATSETALSKQIGIISTTQEQAILDGPSQFVLLTEDGDKIFIESLNIRLRKYVRRRVEIEGTWNESKTVFNLENIISLGNETQVKKVYEDSEKGLKFSYPSIWFISDERNVLGNWKILLAPYEATGNELVDVDTITIEYSENNRKLNAREWLNLDELYRSLNTDDSSIFQQATVGLAQLDAVKKTSGAGDKVEFFVNRDVFIYHFTFTTVNDADSDISKSVFFDIISSFEFIPFGSGVGTTTSNVPESIATSTQSERTEITPRAIIATPPTVQPAQPQGTSSPTTQDTNASLSATRQLFIDYIRNHMGVLAPEPTPDSSGWTITRFEFAYPNDNSENFNAIYVTYEDSNGQRKILLRVSDRSNPETMQRVASFSPGETTDWQLNDGNDTARTLNRVSIRSNLSNQQSSSEETVIRSGMRLMEARSFRINIQYPSNWYWAYESSAGYRFSDRPVTRDNTLLRLTKDSSGLLDNMANISAINSRAATEGQSGDSLVVCVQGNAKYCLTGNVNLRTTMIQMLETLQE